MIKAISFDLWDTIVDDDSDEAKRTAMGLRSKRDERRHLLWQALDRQQPIAMDRVALAYDTADAGFNLVWREQHINWTLEQRLRVVLNGLDRDLAAADFNAVHDTTARMEVDIPPDPIDGIAAALAALAQRYRLCVTSDAIVTPGTGLRALLRGHGLERYFSAFAFSDEVGHSKPHRAMFDQVAGALGVALEDIIHIGDRDQNDVKGPQALGMQAILFTGARDGDREITTAEAICDNHQELPAIVDRLAAATKQ